MTRFWNEGKIIIFKVFEGVESLSSKELARSQKQYPNQRISIKRKTSALALDVEPELRTERCSRGFRPLLERSFRYLSQGIEREKCRPLDHAWQISLIHTVQLLISSHFYIYILKCTGYFFQLVRRSVSFYNCACAFRKHSPMLTSGKNGF